MLVECGHRHSYTLAASVNQYNLCRVCPDHNYSCIVAEQFHFQKHLPKAMLQLCVQLCDPSRLLCPWDFLQARILEWVVIPFSRGSF